MEQYQLDLETIKDFLQENKDRFMDGRYSAYNFYVEDNVFMAFHSDIIDKVEDGKLFSLDSRQFCMELAKLIYGEDMICVKCGAKEAGVHMEGCIFYDGIMKFIKYWAYKLKKWVFLTNEALAHEAALAIRQIKNNTLDK